MKDFSTLHLPIMAFFSRRIYRDVAWNWKGSNLGYLFILLSVCWIAPTLDLREQLAKKIDAEKNGIIAQIPPIHIKNGIVSSDVPQPYRIKKNGKTVAIIDTTGSMNYIADNSVVALLTETQLIFRGAKGFNTLDLGKIEDLTIDQGTINGWLDATQTAMTPGVYGAILLLSFVAASLALVVFAIVGKVFAALLRASLTFGAVLRIAVAATTPALLIFAVSSAWDLPVNGLVYAVITLAYFFIGLAASASAEKRRTVDLFAVL